MQIDWGLDVSRETSERLECYEALLKKWNPAINLVAKSTISELRTRHIIDSVQVFDLAPKGFESWADLGSGGGFPGLVCAIIAKEKAEKATFHLVESDTRKAAFLMTVARETGVNVQVYSERIEKLAALDVDVLSARALAPLEKLLDFSIRHMKKDGLALFQKGARYRSELDEAREKWTFAHEQVVSQTDPDAVVLKIGDIKRG
jgi:16S rRNA (guanine527-N7)-methyltransferase